MPTTSIRPGDILAYPFGMRREIDVITVHATRLLASGNIAIRYSFTANPNGVDWQGVVRAGDPDVRVLSRGVARVRTEPMTLLS